MAKKWKEVLYAAPDHAASTDTGARVSFSVGDDDVGFHHQRLQEMFKNKLQVPGSKEHQSKAVPKTPEEWDKFRAEATDLIFGQAEDSRVNDKNRLEMLFDVPDAYVPQLEAVKYVSPGFVKDFKDGRGHVWPGWSIGHVALTGKPVQHEQDPNWTNLSVPDNITTVWLDLEGFDTTPPSDPQPPATTPTGGAAVGTTEKISRVCALLAKVKKLHVSPAADPNSFLDHLETALQTAEAHDADDDEHGQNQTTEDAMSATAGNSPQVAPQPSIMMSLEAKTKLEKDGVRAKALETELLKSKKTALQARIKTCYAASPVLEEAALQKLETINLSLDDKFELVPNELTYRLDAVEELGGLQDPTAVLLSLGKKPEAVPHPGEEDEAGNDEIADWYSGGRHSELKREKAKAN